MLAVRLHSGCKTSPLPVCELFFYIAGHIVYNQRNCCNALLANLWQSAQLAGARRSAGVALDVTFSSRTGYWMRLSAIRTGNISRVPHQVTRAFSRYRRAAASMSYSAFKFEVSGKVCADGLTDSLFKSTNAFASARAFAVRFKAFSSELAP